MIKPPVEIVETERTIRTYSGIYFNVFDPDVALIKIEDIAHSLAMQCRFNGHTKSFYSVAQHSVWVAERVPVKQKKAALLHDGSEAYLSDIPSPIKKYFTQYHKIEDDVMIAIAKRFDFEYPFDASVKKYDKEALYWEWENKVLNDFNPHENWDFETGKQKFLEYFDSLHRV